MGSAKAGDGGGGNSDSDESGKDGDSGVSGGGKDNDDTTKNSNLKSGNAFSVGRGDATAGRGGRGQWRRG